MKKQILIYGLGALLLAASSCGSKKGSNGGDYSEMAGLSDQGKMQWIIDKAAPDSVARFFFLASVGKIEEAAISNYADAYVAVADAYGDNSREFDTFVQELEIYYETQPLEAQLRYDILKEGAGANTDSLAYKAGLSFPSYIRARELTSAQVEKELSDLKAAQPQLYPMVLEGFKKVLNHDKGVDIPKDIYEKYSR